MLGKVMSLDYLDVRFPSLEITLIALEHIRATLDKLPRLPEFQVTVFHVTKQLLEVRNTVSTPARVLVVFIEQMFPEQSPLTFAKSQATQGACVTVFGVTNTAPLFMNFAHMV